MDPKAVAGTTPNPQQSKTPDFIPDGGATPDFIPHPVETTSTGIAAPQGTESKFGSSYAGDLIQRGMSGIGRGLQGIAGFAKQFGGDLANPDMPVFQPNAQGQSMFNTYVKQPAEQEKARSLQEAQAMRQTSGLESVGHGITSMAHTFGEMIPGVGPIAGSLLDRARGGDIMGAATEGATLYGAPKAAKGIVDTGISAITEAPAFLRRAKTVNGVTTAAAGTYQGTIQPLFQTLGENIKAEGARTIQQAIDADKKATLVPGQGTISVAPAVAAAAEAIEKTGYAESPKMRSLMARLQNNTLLNLEDAKNLRSEFGEAAAKARAAGDMKANSIYTAGYDELGGGMKGRIKELQGTEDPYHHYNNEFKSYYELRDGIAGQMMRSIADRHEAVPQLEKFADADLSELKEQARKYGMDPSKFDQAQKDARSVTAAHNSLQGKYNKSLMRVVMDNKSTAATLTGLGVYAAAHGAGLYGIAPILAGMYVANKMRGIPDEIETGRVLRKLRVNPDSFQVRTPVEGPKTFNYPNQDDVYSQPSTPNPSSPPSGSPETTTPSGRPVPEEVLKIQQQRGTKGVSPDVGNWQPPPELGAFSAPDYGKTAREANPEPTRKEVKAAAVKKAQKR